MEFPTRASLETEMIIRELDFGAGEVDGDNHESPANKRASVASSTESDRCHSRTLSVSPVRTRHSSVTSIASEASTIDVDSGMSAFREYDLIPSVEQVSCFF